MSKRYLALDQGTVMAALACLPARCPVGGSEQTITRLDREHGDITTLAERLGVDEWPDEEQRVALRAVDTLRAEPVDAVDRDGSTVLELEVPQPGAVLVEVVPPR
ncbi:hypothetical protein [Micromonospora sp. NPDC047738]|uniref:hypothetical protein n=1 Tax=unclassified Micromonospora TaxID=2617518 RepID=UPI0033E06D85